MGTAISDLFEPAKQFERDLLLGKVPPTTDSREPYLHPLERMSARTSKIGPALCSYVDYYDYEHFGDTQITAPEGKWALRRNPTTSAFSGCFEKVVCSSLEGF